MRREQEETLTDIAPSTTLVSKITIRLYSQKVVNQKLGREKGRIRRISRTTGPERVRTLILTRYIRPNMFTIDQL
jgi:hypothetical protein